MLFNKKIPILLISTVATTPMIITSCSSDKKISIEYSDTVYLSESESLTGQSTFKLVNYESDRYVEKFYLDIDGVYDSNDNKIDYYYDYSYDQSSSSYNNVLYFKNNGDKGKLTKGEYKFKIKNILYRTFKHNSKGYLEYKDYQLMNKKITIKVF